MRISSGSNAKQDEHSNNMYRLNLINLPFDDDQLIITDAFFHHLICLTEHTVEVNMDDSVIHT